MKIQGRLYNVKRVKKGKKECLLEVTDIETDEERAFIIKSIRLLEVIENLPLEVERAQEGFLLLDADEGTWQICSDTKLRSKPTSGEHS